MMKSNSYKYTLITSLILALAFSIHCFSQENDASNYKMSFKFKTIKQADNSRLLEASFIATNKKDRKDKVPAYDAEIKFYNFFEDQEIELGSSKTSDEGIAQIILPPNQKYLTDEEGYIHVIARFKGSEGLDTEEDEISFKDLFIELELTEIDSIKTVLVKAFSKDSLGNETLVEEADINFYVEGMLSKLKINEGSISEGTYEFEMPTDIPGDVNGNLNVYAMIVDNDDYGNITQMKSINWGAFDKQIKVEKNKLWSQAAPIWMYVVLTILLVGVWANYVYTIFYLFKIRNESKPL